MMDMELIVAAAAVAAGKSIHYTHYLRSILPLFRRIKKIAFGWASDTGSVRGGELVDLRISNAVFPSVTIRYSTVTYEVARFFFVFEYGLNVMQQHWRKRDSGSSQHFFQLLPRDNFIQIQSVDEISVSARRFVYDFNGKFAL
jgi:hypothetical protein